MDLCNANEDINRQFRYITQTMFFQVPFILVIASMVCVDGAPVIDGYETISGIKTARLVSICITVFLSRRLLLNESSSLISLFSSRSDTLMDLNKLHGQNR